ncbi:hypothetical protein BC829DRAFT_394221, partial [Chytridium lagenaria]
MDVDSTPNPSASDVAAMVEGGDDAAVGITAAEFIEEPLPKAVPPKSDKLDRLRAAASKNPWSLDAWQSFLNEATQKSDASIGREAYDLFLKQFPTSFRHWIQYIEFEQRHRAFDRVEALFRTCLPMVVSVELWRFYLTYIRRTHATTSTSTPEEKTESRRVISEAFEFVLGNIGQDKDSGGIWLDYLQFIKTGEAANTYEEQQRMDHLRKIYHKALAIPLSNVEAIWKDYDAFENGLNKITAKKLLSEKSAIYMTARTAYRELKNRMASIDGMLKSWLATPPTWTQKELNWLVLDAWKGCIMWEQSNPLRLEDTNLLKARVMYSFKSALLMLRFFPEMVSQQYDVSEYLISIGKTEDAATILKQAIEIMPKSPLLTFALCEIEETLKRDSESISAVYEKLIKHLEDEVDTASQRYDQERKDLLDSLNKRGEREREKLKEHEKEVEVKVEVRRKEEIEKLKSAVTISWIVYMRFARRSQNIRSAREVFKKARKSPVCKYQLYVASALMEYYCSKDVNVATKVFEAGMKAFTDEESLSSLILKYLEFLISIDDQNNARALFERALNSLKPEHCRQIWSRFLSHEIHFGDLGTVLKTEKRMSDFYSEEERAEHRLGSLSERWSFLDLSYVGDYELGLFTHSSSHDKAPARSTKSITKLKTNAIETAVSDKYPRPDFSKWNIYKPEPPQNPPQRPGSSTQDSGPAPSSSNAPNAAPSQPVSMIPDAIVRFLDLLPLPAAYNGPLIPIADVLDLLKHVPIPMPATPPTLVPLTITGPPPHLMNDGPPSRGFDSGPSGRQMDGRQMDGRHMDMPSKGYPPSDRGGRFPPRVCSPCTHKV